MIKNNFSELGVKDAALLEMVRNKRITQKTFFFLILLNRAEKGVNSWEFYKWYLPRCMQYVTTFNKESLLIHNRKMILTKRLKGNEVKYYIDPYFINLFKKDAAFDI